MAINLNGAEQNSYGRTMILSPVHLLQKYFLNIKSKFDNIAKFCLGQKGRNGFCQIEILWMFQWRSSVKNEVLEIFFSFSLGNRSQTLRHGVMA